MKTIVAVTAFALLALQAHARCYVNEYAQYKDKARTRDGRTGLALDYCLAKDLSEIRPGTEDSRECHRGMFKILDALNATKAKAMVNWAIDGCKGTPPK